MRGLGLFTGYWRPANLGPPTPPIHETVKEAAEANYGVAFGMAGDPKNVMIPEVLALSALEGNEYIPENVGKMDRWAGGGVFSGDNFAGVYNFDDYNQSVEYARAIGARFRQHVLFYFQNMPNWLDDTTQPPVRATTGTGVTPEQLRNVMISQFDAIRMNAPATITDLEIFNELGPYNLGWGIRETIWWRSPGFGYASDPDQHRWLVEAYKLAAQYLPGYRLGINDFDVERAGVGKGDGYYAMLVDILNPARPGGPAPINWVGLQSHFGTVRGFDPADPGSLAQMRTQLARINDIPATFEIHLTEMDYAISVPNTSNFDNFDGSLADQMRAGDAMHNWFGVALSYPKVTVMSCWGITDARSWLYKTFPGTGCGLPYGYDYRKKPMWWGLWNACANQCDKLIHDSAKPSTVVADRDWASAGYRLDWATDAIGDSLVFSVGMPEGNTYGIRVGYVNRPAGGTFQTAVSTDQGQTWTDIGAPLSMVGADAYTYADLVGAFTVSDAQVVLVRFTTTVVGLAQFDYLRVTPTMFVAPARPIIETPQPFALAAGQSVERTVTLNDAAAEVTAKFANPLGSTGSTVSISGTGLTRTITVTCGANTTPGMAIVIVSAKLAGKKSHSAFSVWLGEANAPFWVAAMVPDQNLQLVPVAGQTNSNQWEVIGSGTRTHVSENNDTVTYVRSTGRGGPADGLSQDNFYEFNRENLGYQKVQPNHTYRFYARVRISANDNITLGVGAILTNGGPRIATVLATVAAVANEWTDISAVWTPAPGSIPDGSQMNTYVRPYIAGPAAGVVLDIDRFYHLPDNMNVTPPS